MLRYSLLLLGAILMISCGYREYPQLEFMPDMYQQISLQAQEYDSTTENGVGMRQPVEGTVPRGWEPYTLELLDTTAAAELVNPLLPTQDVLEAGRKYYMNYCIVCHGTTGDGIGYIIPKFTQPPVLYSDKVKNWPDGRLYHVITKGQGLMSSYASQLLPQQRWAVIHYVRALQRAATPTAEDLELYPDSEFTFEDDLPDTAEQKLWPER